MILESARQGTTTQGIGNGVIEIRLRPHLAQDFKFTKVRVISEGPGLKLLMIS